MIPKSGGRFSDQIMPKKLYRETIGMSEAGSFPAAVNV
jgi:hypothetical protein